MYALKEQNRLKAISNLAIKALYIEVELTPKPGLVDKLNSGSHHDMDIHTFYASIKAISPFFEAFLSQGLQDAKLPASHSFKNLKQLGIECEEAMFEATKGVNTHKGAIFSFAVVLGAIGRVLGEKEDLKTASIQKEIKHLCSFLVQKELNSLKSATSAGEKYFLKSKNGGIRQEAQEGYPTLFTTTLSSFSFWLEKEGEQRALKKTLLLLMSQLEDTTLWSRGKEEGLAFVQRYAKKSLSYRGDLDLLLKEFDTLLIQKNLSPGGSADLLSLTYFLHKLLKNDQ